MKHQLWFLYYFPYPHGAIIHASCHWAFPTKGINGRHTVLVTEPERRGRGWERAEERDGRRRQRGEGRLNRRWVMEGKEKEKEDGDSKKDERERREQRNWKWGQRKMEDSGLHSRGRGNILQARGRGSSCILCLNLSHLKHFHFETKPPQSSCYNLQCLHVSHFIHVPQFHCPVKGAAEQLMCTPPKCQTLQ